MEEHLYDFPSIVAVPLFTLFVAGLSAAIGAWMAFWPPKPNAWAGTRVPWAYADEEIWYAAQRVTGWVILVCGLLAFIYWPVGIGLMIPGTIYMFVHPWMLYARKYGTGKTWHDGKGWRGYRPMVKCSLCGSLVKLNHADELGARTCDDCGQVLVRGM